MARLAEAEGEGGPKLRCVASILLGQSGPESPNRPSKGILEFGGSDVPITSAMSQGVAVMALFAQIPVLPGIGPSNPVSTGTCFCADTPLSGNWILKPFQYQDPNSS